MVLFELGKNITNALSKISQSSKIDEKTFQILLNDISKALMNADVSMALIHQLNENIKKSVGFGDLPTGIDVRRVIEKAVIEEITNLLDPKVEPYQAKKGKPNVFMSVGLQGAGKTTTVTKLAYHYRVRGWKVGLVCADTFRAGAFAQLKQNATKAKIPFYGDEKQSDPVIIANEGVKTFKSKGFEIIIVDTSGRDKQDEALFEEMEQISNAIKPDDVIFVLDSTIGQQAQAQAEAFRSRVDVSSVIITKLDGNAKGGGALSAVAATKAPITFIGIGEHVNELEKFNTSRFVKRILGRGDVEGLVEAVRDQKLDVDNKDLVAAIKKGKFTLRMMKDQFQNILKLGSFGQIMSMIPGLNNLPKESEEASSKRLQCFLVMMDSMTQDELDGDISIIENSPSRRKRIAKGAGVNPIYINELIQVYKPFAHAAKQMKKLPFGKNGELPKNPQQMGKLAGMVPQQVLKQMGGQQGFMNLMQQLQGSDPNAAMGQMANMQKMMQSMGKVNKIQRRTVRR